MSSPHSTSSPAFVDVTTWSFSPGSGVSSLNLKFCKEKMILGIFCWAYLPFVFIGEMCVQIPSPIS